MIERSRGHSGGGAKVAHYSPHLVTDRVRGRVRGRVKV